jgi:solute carrier family 8 (sodium/calcium exchanger)
MEYMAFPKCLDNVSKKDLAMDTFVSDRPSSIAKHMKEKLPMVIHYFDLWHLVKSMYYAIW